METARVLNEKVKTGRIRAFRKKDGEVWTAPLIEAELDKRWCESTEVTLLIREDRARIVETTMGLCLQRIERKVVSTTRQYE